MDNNFEPPSSIVREHIALKSFTLTSHLLVHVIWMTTLNLNRIT